ncbi:MAG TPA: hypothetical protein VLG50_03055, partial [Candidatus Saccharimonadales bacterium]|nr:hypothetical protein [Candidatus Saccharimonadales bacterium]
MKNSFSKKSILVLIAMLCIQTNNSSAAFDDETPQPQDNDHHIQHNKPNIHDITGAQGLLDMPDYPRDQFCKNLT